MPHETDARTRLTAFDLGCVVVGGIIGVGIFFTPARVAAVVDNAWQVIGAWGLGGMIALLGALVFADLAYRVPGHGGTFLYIRTAFGRFPAFLYGWANWLVIQAGALAIIGMILVDNLDIALFGRATIGSDLRVMIAAVAILCFTAINAIGLRLGTRVQNALTVTKTLAVFSLVVLALLSGGGEAVAETESARPVRGWLWAMAAAILPVLFSFGGWQQGSFLAGAARRPRRDVPLGIIAGVVVVVVAYITVNLAFLDILGFEAAALSATIGADAARVALEPYGIGELGSRLLAGAVVVSSLGILNTICLAPPYVLHAMAREGLFLKSCGVLHARLGTPLIGVLVQGCQGVLLLVGVHMVFREQSLDTLDFLLTGVVFVDWLFFCLCGMALLRLGRRQPQAGLPVPGVPLMTLAFTLLAAAVTVGALWTKLSASIVGIAVCGVGALAYLGTRR